jgi:tetratricopeptide (TPR) repeat protein
MNDYKPNVAAINRSNSLVEQLTQHPTKEPWPERRDRLRKLLADGGDFRVKNDLATTLAHTGEAEEAVKLLEEVEAEKPGLYFTAANLGTAYELAGDDRKALEWIRKGIERNPDAHDGTEWLHVLILQAKLAVAEDPKWLETHFILGDPVESMDAEGFAVRRGAIGSGAVGNRGEKLTPEQVKTALLYQLHERLQFVKPPDTVVGALLLDLGDLVADEPIGMGGAAGIFELASKYLKQLPPEHPLSTQVLERQLMSSWGQRSPGTRPSEVVSLVLFFVVGPALALLTVSLKRRIQRRLAASS